MKKGFKLFLLFCLLNLGAEVNALQNIITLPSSDVLKKDAILIKQTARVYPYKSKHVNVIPSVNVGLGRGIEASVSVPVDIKFNDGSTTEKMTLEAKKVFYMGSDTNRLSIGGAVSPSLNMPVCPDMYLYTHLTKVIPKTGTSLTAGGYLTGEKHFTNKGGMLFALDQKVIGDKLRVVTEVSTGENNRSVFGAGVKYKLINDFSLIGAVLVPIQGSDNVGFQFTLLKFILPEKAKENL